MEAEKAAELLWDEWKYRNTLYWQMFYRFGFIVLFVSFIPYVYPERICDIGRLVVVFPIVGALLSIVAALLLDAESARFSAVKDEYDKLRSGYVPEEFPERSAIWKFRKTKIGYLISVLFGVVLFLLSILNAIYLWNYFGQSVCQEKVVSTEEVST